MGFKLGKSRGNYAVNGEIRNKMRFGNQAGDADASVPGTPVIRTSLGPGIRGEANMDGTIYISDLIEPGSDEEREVINHEMRHATDIKIGKLAYDDDHVMYNGERFERDYVIDENGDVIDAILVEGEWKEVGSHDFPWESDANNGS
tara:strand:+ start:343 stop:780 length:438 start_codon:yes stop_codon:yes gene_type:complete